MASILFGIVIFVLIGVLLGKKINEGSEGYVVSFIIAAIVSALLSFASVQFEGLGSDYSTGYRDGFVQKVSTKGVIFKTHEGELNVFAGDQMVAGGGTIWEFSISDPKVLQDIEAAQGKKLRLHYREWIVQPASMGSTSYEITKVEILNK